VLRVFGTIVNPEQEVQIHCGRKLWSAAEPAIVGIIVSSNATVRRVEQVRRQEFVRLFADAHAPQLSQQGSGRALHLVRLLTIGLSHAQQNPRKARHVVAILGRKVSAAIKGDTLGSEEHRHRPTAVLGHHLHSVHIDLVQVGALFAIDLDTDEVLVHQSGDLFVLERFVLHHVAPVTSRVADAKEQGLVLKPRLRKCLFRPGVPVNGIMRMLQ
jgi:hypothetical protein